MKTCFSVTFLLALCAVTTALEKHSVKDRLAEMRKDHIENNRKTSPEAVAEYDAKRALHIEKLLEEHGRKLQDHKSGRRLLDDEEHRKLLRQVDAFQRKLTQINGATDKDRMERLLEVREHQNELRVDYLDFDKPDF